MKEKIVCVEWLDACSSAGFLDRADDYKKHNPVFCRTVGFLAKIDKTRVIVTSELYEDGDNRHIHTIPRRMVKKITYLKEVTYGQKERQKEEG